MKNFTIEELQLIISVMIGGLMYLTIGYYIAKYTYFNHGYLRKILLENKILKETIKDLEKEMKELI